MKFEVSNASEDELGLNESLQQFADAYWLPEHVTKEQAAAIVLDAFKRKVAGELELLDVTVNK